MKHLHRRDFLKMSSIGAVFPFFPSQNISEDFNKDNSLINFISDGLNLSPADYAQVLTKITQKENFQADLYALNGCVEELETKFAKLLGKEAAVFMPTGTLANHLAVRTLSGKNNRILVQNESHLYNDTGDCAQTLSNLNLIPLGNDKATFSVNEVNEVLKKTATGRVAAKVGVISIESPVRRKSGEMFDYEQMKQISQLAKANDIKMHLDGARIFMAFGYTGITPAEYSTLFDTVYVSLYKYFNAASGAILAGTKEVIAPMYHTRRMFGGGLRQAWAFAAVALHYLDGFSERYTRAVKISEDLIQKLKSKERFEVQRIPNGTNIFNLGIKGINATDFAENLKKNGIIIPAGNTFPLHLTVNESLLRSSADEIFLKFKKSL